MALDSEVLTSNHIRTHGVYPPFSRFSLHVGVHVDSRASHLRRACLCMMQYPVQLFKGKLGLRLSSVLLVTELETA